jgi:hypothetical protein
LSKGRENFKASGRSFPEEPKNLENLEDLENSKDLKDRT